MCSLAQFVRRFFFFYGITIGIGFDNGKEDIIFIVLFSFTELVQIKIMKELALSLLSYIEYLQLFDRQLNV